MKKVHYVGMAVVALLGAFALNTMREPDTMSDTERQRVMERVFQPDTSADSWAGRTPAKRIVHENGECSGVLFTDGTYDGLCDMQRTSELPTITFEEIFPPDRVPLD